MQANGSVAIFRARMWASSLAIVLNTSDLMAFTDAASDIIPDVAVPSLFERLSTACVPTVPMRRKADVRRSNAVAAASNTPVLLRPVLRLSSWAIADLNDMRLTLSRKAAIAVANDDKPPAEPASACDESDSLKMSSEAAFKPVNRMLRRERLPAN